MASLISLLQTNLDQLPSGATLPIQVKIVAVKEHLQTFALDYIYNHSTYRKLNFYGGTCARVMYGLNRMSEDIDLDNSDHVDLISFNSDILQYFQGVFQIPEATMDVQKGELGITRFTLRLPILIALGLSTNEKKKIHVKIEVSNHTQVAHIENTPVLRHGKSMVIRHFDLPSLMAGKIIACLERTFQKGNSTIFIKGRDFYDLIWYMQKNIQPNVQKLAKDGDNQYSINSAFALLRKKVHTISSTDLSLDLLPLFTEQAYIHYWISHFHEFFYRYLDFYHI